MRRSRDPLALALPLAAALAEALAVLPWIRWLAVVLGGDPVRAPSWLAVAGTGLVAFAWGRWLVRRDTDPALARLASVAAWLVWLLLWWSVRQRDPHGPLHAVVAALAAEASLLGLAVLSALAWWRGLSLASEPRPFQGAYLRWVVVRDVAFLVAVVSVAALGGGPGAAVVWATLRWSVPLWLALRLLVAALVQAEALTLAAPSRVAARRVLAQAVVVTLAVFTAGALLSALAGPAVWHGLAAPVTWLFTLVVAVVVTLTVALVLLVWFVLRVLVWLFRQLGDRPAPEPPPSLPSLPELLRWRESVAALALPDWLWQLLAALLAALLLALLARWIAAAWRRLRTETHIPAGSEVRERVSGESLALQLPRLRWRFPGARFPPRPQPPVDVRSAYRAVLLLLARHGLRRQPSETPLQFLQRVAASMPAAARALHDLTERYLRARYGERETPDDRAAALADWADLAQQLAPDRRER